MEAVVEGWAAALDYALDLGDEAHRLSAALR
jgi:hypothetical protein